MKYNRLAPVFIAASLLATPCVAASVTMVQFGSFETREEADKRLAEMKSTYAAQLGALTGSVREIKLPPDNLSVYRTQAGPVDSRAAAQEICSKISSGGDECYIVQTALVDKATLATASNSVKPVEAKPAEIKPTGDAPDLTKKLSLLRDSDKSSTMLTPAPAPSADLQAALDKAAAEQSSVSENVTQKLAADAPKTTQEKPGFWSSVNPFSSTPASAPAPAEVKTAAPVEPVSEAAATAAASEVSSRLLAAIEKPAPVIRATEKPIALPPIRPIALAPATQGGVDVEEAKRVPLTEGVLSPVAVVATQPAVSLLPSSTNGQKTIWAQIGPFYDNAAAQAFWASYRQTHPDFPVVRVRTTTPYGQYVKGSAPAWLRVGPMANAGFVQNLCASLTPEQNLRCGYVKDLGVAASVHSGGFLSGSRYKR